MGPCSCRVASPDSGRHTHIADIGSVETDDTGFDSARVASNPAVDDHAEPRGEPNHDPAHRRFPYMAHTHLKIYGRFGVLRSSFDPVLVLDQCMIQWIPNWDPDATRSPLTLSTQSRALPTVAGALVQYAHRIAGGLRTPMRIAS